MVAVDKAGRAQVFVAHRATGVRLIPADWLEAWRPSGFREASALEVMGWYAARDLDAPDDVLSALTAERDAPEDERPLRAITLPAGIQPMAPPV